MLAFAIGGLQVHRVEELRIPNHISYFTDNAPLIDANRHWLSPHFLDAEGRFDLVFQSWIFEADGRMVLVDPCTGNGKPHPVPFFDRLDVPFIERMGESGYRPQDIDIVVCTHLHHDHCGWNTRLRGGQWVPTFPNARYVMQQAEVALWRGACAHHDPSGYNAGVFERSVQPILEAGLAELVHGDHRLSARMTVTLSAGHTPGHQMLRVGAGEAPVYFTGDCFHHPIQLVDPSIHFGDVADPAQLVATRQRIARLSAREEAALIAAHLPAPYGIVARESEGVLRFAAIPPGAAPAAG